jgi:Gas vesicle synthesis protein GvpO
MAERTASEQRQRRSKARDRRRAMAAEPFEQLDQAARESDSGEGHDALKQAMATAAAGAVAAGIAGAAKALHDRRTSEEGEDEEAPAHDEPPSEKPEAERTEPQAEAEGSEQAPDDENGGEEEPQQEPQPEPEPEPEAEAGGDESEDGDKRPRGGASTGDAKAVVDGARRELQEVLGREPESVSGIRRSDDGWVVTVEVVEVDRIPDSTDVLSSYEVTLDDDRKLVGVEQKRRYLRSQVAEG